MGFGWFTFVFLFLIFICMCIDVVPECMYVYHMCACSLRRQKRMSEHLELELQSVVSSHVTMWVPRLEWGSSERQPVLEPSSHLSSHSFSLENKAKFETVQRIL